MAAAKPKMSDIAERAVLLMERGIDLVNRRMIIGIPFMEHNVDNDVGFPLAANFQAGLHVLQHMYVPIKDTQPREHIEIEFSSYGGDLYSSLGIYDMLRRVTVSVPVHMYVYGPCMSGGSLILQAATKRYMSPNSKLMIHYGFTWDEGTSDPDRLRENLREHEETMDAIVGIYLSRCIKAKLDEQKLRQHLRIETYISAQSCVEWGLADGIIPIAPNASAQRR